MTHAHTQKNNNTKLKKKRTKNISSQIDSSFNSKQQHWSHIQGIQKTMPNFKI